MRTNSTFQRNALSHESQAADDRRSALAAESERRGDSFAGGTRDGERRNALSPGTQSGDAWTIDHINCAVHDLAHPGHDVSITGVKDRGVAEVVLALLGQGDGSIDVRDPHKR